MPISEIEHEIIYKGSFEGTIQDQGSSGRMKYLVGWEDLLDFISELRGGYRLINETVWTYQKPEEHPNVSGLFAQSVSFSPIGRPTVTGAVGSRVVSWEYGIVDATFDPLPFDDTEPGGAGERISEELDFGAEVITINTYDSQQKPVQVAKRLPLVVYVITLNHVPTLPGGNATLIQAMSGKVNSETFRGAAPGYMLFEGARARRSLASLSAFNNLKHWQVEFRFAYRSIKWNEIYNQTTGALEPALIAPGVPLYQSDDLNELIANLL